MKTINDSIKLASGNDAFRDIACGSTLQSMLTFSSYGRLMLTESVRALTDEKVRSLLSSVQHFSDFTEDNDSYGEHDFGKIKTSFGDFFWKINYYDVNYEFGSPNPVDIKQTRRVLTIMRTSDY